MIGFRIFLFGVAALVAASMARSADPVPDELPPTSVRPPVPLPSVLQMGSPRAVHAAVPLSDGRVVLIGGCVVNGCEPGPGSRSVDIFNPQTNRFAPRGPLRVARIGTAAVGLSDGRVLIAGGWNGPQPTASVEIFDPNTGASVEVARLSRPRADMAAVTLNDGRVALIGGYDGRMSVGDVTLFDPRTRRLSAGPVLATARAGAAAVRLRDGRVLVVGGGEGAGTLRPSAAAEIADAALEGWLPAGRLNVARYKHAAVALNDGRALVIGGSDARDRQGKIAAIEAFDPVRGAFVAAGRTQSLRFKIANAVVVLGDGRVFIGGGAEKPEIYDPRTRRSVMSERSVGAVLSFSTASLLPDGRVLIAGGYEENSIAVTRGVWLVRP